MKKSEIEATFTPAYLSLVQILVKLADTPFLYCELGRGSGKTTHILAPRIDRVQESMPGAILVLAAATYRSLFENILPGILEYFSDNYERGIYFEFGREAPRHFKPCHTWIANWRHTISFCNGCVIQFVSADRPESMLGKNAAHLFVDEMLRIPEEKFLERIIPALRADRSKYAQSPYFMGISGFSSTPNFETDDDWFLKYEHDMNNTLIDCIQEIAWEIDLRLAELELAKKQLDLDRIKRLARFVERWNTRLAHLRRGQTFYLRASSFSNLKILGIDYIQNQIKSIKDKDMLYTAIFAIRKLKVENMFFGKFNKQHLFDQGKRIKKQKNQLLLTIFFGGC
jgi:hypothetical protein